MSRPIPMNGLSRNTPDRLKPFPTVPTQSRVVLFDDFLGDELGAGWTYVEGTDGATANAAILATGAGGILRFTTGDAGTGLAADMAQLNNALQIQPSNGGVDVIAKLALSQITDCYMFFGLTDTAALEGPVVSAANANDITTNASNAAGFMFDTRMAADNFWFVGVEADTDAQAQNSLVAPVAGTEVELRLKVSAQGHASFFINGIGVGSVMEDAVAPNAALTLTLAVSKVTGATSMTMDVDYAGFAMNR